MFGFILLLVIALVLLALLAIAHWYFRTPEPAWDSGVGDEDPPRKVEVEPPARRMLERLGAVDKNFSIVVFEDFVGALYTQSLLAAGRGELAGFSAYLNASAFQSLQARDVQGLSVVLPGSITVEQTDGVQDPNAEFVGVTLRIEANLAQRNFATGEERAIYTNERWRFIRNRGVQSKPPERTQTFTCPNCGGPLAAVLAGKCNQCGKYVASGAFDWSVQRAEVLYAESRGPMLTGTTEETGTHNPTIVDRSAESRAQQLAARDPAFQWPNFQSRVHYIFQQFQLGWSNRDLQPMRPYLSDALFSTQTYWVQEYLKQKLRNVTENAHVVRIDLARVTSDAYFDAITVRIFAESLDYTLADSTGQTVAGSRTEPRQYTEYWTLIRGRSTHGPAKADPTCPRCSAPIDVTVAGECKYCKAKVTSGEFDWVLSRIEQDEVYQG
jgi:ribosomal protein L37AE/L43A